MDRRNALLAVAGITPALLVGGLGYETEQRHQREEAAVNVEVAALTARVAAVEDLTNRLAPQVNQLQHIVEELLHYSLLLEQRVTALESAGGKR